METGTHDQHMVPRHGKSEQKTVYMQPEAAKYYDENAISTIGLDPGQVDLSGIGTHAWLKCTAGEQRRWVAAPHLLTWRVCSKKLRDGCSRRLGQQRLCGRYSRSYV